MRGNSTFVLPSKNLSFSNPLSLRKNLHKLNSLFSFISVLSLLRIFLDPSHPPICSTAAVHSPSVALRLKPPDSLYSILHENLFRPQTSETPPKKATPSRRTRYFPYYSRKGRKGRTRRLANILLAVDAVLCDQSIVLPYTHVARMRNVEMLFHS